MDQKILGELGDELHAALVGRTSVAPISERYPEMSVNDDSEMDTFVLGNEVE